MKLEITFVNKLYFIVVSIVLTISFLKWFYYVDDIIISTFLIYLLLILCSVLILIEILLNYKRALYHSFIFCLIIGSIFIFNMTVLKYYIAYLISNDFSILVYSINDYLNLIFGMFSVFLSYWLNKKIKVDNQYPFNI